MDNIKMFSCVSNRETYQTVVEIHDYLKGKIDKIRVNE